MTTRFAAARRVVIKIGSSLLVESETGAIRQDWLAALAADVAACRRRGQEVVLVSSGAIAIGRRSFAGARHALKLEEKQAAAALGQIRLAHAYQQALEPHAVTIAQVLLTIGDTEERRRHLNARSTLDTLLKVGAVPVINENDTVATAEIRFGDNDRLAARVAQMISADALVLLSDIDGLYTADPGIDPQAEFIPEVADISPAIEAMAGGSLSADGSGGMVTKLIAARIAVGAGCHMAIAAGRPLHPLARLDDPDTRCTWFLASAEPLTARKRWIAGSLHSVGSLSLDAGACAALARGKSLLPAGVTAVEGSFERGDAVALVDPSGRELGRGLSAYGSADACRIKGHKSREIEQILGYRGRDEMVHRDDLVLF